MRASALVLLAAAVLAGCASGGLSRTTFQPDVYVVRPGDTIYSIAWRYQIDPDQLIRWNGIDDPDRLRVGRRLRLSPDASLERTATRRDRGSSVSSPDREPGQAGGATRAADEGSAEEASGKTESDPAPAGHPGRWRWPTDGRLVGTFADGRVPGRGVDISGSAGQPIVATAAGEVVYSGEGLQAYGRLVIIRHEGEYLSAYAHNSEVLVREGQRVTAGQQIARMGGDGEDGPLLHFEIRRRGKPVDPLDYLPSRD